MSFNKNASKRLSIVAGIDRTSRDILDYINCVTGEYIKTYLERLVYILVFTNRKTVMVEDIRILSHICREYPHIICSDTLSVKKDIIHTLHKPFEDMIRDIIKTINPEIRLGKNTVTLLQNLVEHYIIKLMSIGSLFMRSDRRDTLLLKDLENAEKILKNY